MDYILPSDQRIDNLAEIVKEISKSEETNFDILVVCNSTSHCPAVQSRIDSVSSRKLAENRAQQTKIKDICQ